MALFSRLPNGGGLSSTKVLTDVDLKCTAKYGDLISQRTVDSNKYPRGGVYLEGDTLYIQTSNSSNAYMSIITLGEGSATLVEDVVIPEASATISFELNSEITSDIIVLSSATGTSNSIFLFNKKSHEIITVSAPKISGTVVYFYGATIHNGTIYATGYCNSEKQPCLFMYDESGTLNSSWNNDYSLYGCNAPVCFDSNGNVYMSCDGLQNNGGYNVMVSLNSDGTLRWGKKLTDIKTSYGVKLISVNSDGTSLWKSLVSPYELLMVDSNGNILKKSASIFSYDGAVKKVKWLVEVGLIQIADTNGLNYYLVDYDLNQMGKLTVAGGGSIPCVVFTDNSIMVVRYESYLMIDEYKPYNEYIRR